MNYPHDNHIGARRVSIMNQYGASRSGIARVTCAYCGESESRWFEDLDATSDQEIGQAFAGIGYFPIGDGEWQCPVCEPERNP